MAKKAKRKRPAKTAKTAKAGSSEERRRVVSLKGYARHRGVSPAAVQRAIRSGRLTAATRDDRGWWRIDVDKADAEWTARTHPGKRRSAAQSRPRARSAGQASMFEDDDAASGSGSESTTLPPLSGRGPMSPNMVRAQAAKLYYQAALTRLDYELRAKEAVSAESVRLEAFSLGRRIRDEILQVPDRLAPELVGLSDERDIHQRLVEELTAALRTLQDVGPDAAAG